MARIPAIVIRFYFREQEEEEEPHDVIFKSFKKYSVGEKNFMCESDIPNLEYT